MRGNIQPRYYYNLGSNEGRKGNNVRVAKHFAIAARSGDDDALTLVREELQGGVMKLKKFYGVISSSGRKRLYEERTKRQGHDRDGYVLWSTYILGLCSKMA